MDSLTAIGLDVAAVAVVVYCAYAAAKKGFLRTVVQMIAMWRYWLPLCFSAVRPRRSFTIVSLSRF